MGAVYIVEQNLKVSSSCVYHRLYFTHKLKNPIIKPHRKISKEPAANYSSGFWHHSSPTLLHDRKGQKLTTKKDILGFTLEKKTKQQEVGTSDGLGCSGDTQNHHICQHISVYVRFTLDIFIKVSKRFFRCAYFLFSEVANFIFTCYLGLSMLLNR